MDDFLVDRVLLAVEQIPAGRVASYGDVARVVGTGPRQVGNVLSRYGGDVGWWRVSAHDGGLPAALLGRARERWAAEGIPVAANRARIADCRADLPELRRAYRRALDALLARTGTPLPVLGGPASRALAANGVTALEHLVEWSPAELLALHGVGPKTVGIIETALAEHGWGLRERPASD